MATRTLKPRTPIAVQAAFVSQENCAALLGVNPRRFLEHVVPLCGGHVVKLGKLRLVPLDVAIAKLRALASSDDVEGIDLTRDDDDDPQPQTADDVLRALGKTRAA